jgi:hypothetical protein
MFKLAVIILCAVGVLLCVLPAYSMDHMLLIPACAWVGICRTAYRLAR